AEPLTAPPGGEPRAPHAPAAGPGDRSPEEARDEPSLGAASGRIELGLMRVLDADRVEIATGDLLCLHTGFAELVAGMAGSPDPAVLHHASPVLDGKDARLVRWIAESGIAALAAYNYAVEGFPARPSGPGPCEGLPLHQACLFRLGIPLGELWYLTQLARWLRRNGRHRFLLTCPPLRMPGSFGSPVTPVATV
ncbi:MAG TPA: hypothetical protein VIV57_10455, partial [Anaeromyxobacter sp.]